MSERDNRVKAFEKLMRGGLSSMDVFCMKNQLMAMGVLYGSCFYEVPRKL